MPKKEAWKMGKHKIRTQVKTLEIMNTKQPRTISIDGVEIPSFSLVSERHWRCQRKIGHLKVVIAIHCIVTAFLALGLLLR